MLRINMYIHVSLWSQVQVPISGQAPIMSVTDAVPLLRTSQEKLISVPPVSRV